MPHRSTTASLFSESNPSVARPASSHWIIAHCDGGARGNPGPAGYGALIQDSNGAVLAQLSEFLGNRTNNYAEYSGLLGCLQYALDHHHSRLRVISDSELMVKQIQGKYKVNSPDLKPLWQEAKNRIARLEAFEISHALRHKNKDADRLANEAMDRGTKRPPTTPAAPQPPQSAQTSPKASASADVGSSPASNTTPSHQKSEASPGRESFNSKADAMLRGFTRDGVVHILGSATLPDGIFVKIIRE